MTASAPEQPPVGTLGLADPARLPVLAPSDLDDVWQSTESPPGTVRLLTVQAPEACRRLAAGDRLSGSLSHVEPGAVAAYAWMTVQLERLGWQVQEAPVWAWARVDFDELVGVWPAGAVDDVVALVVQVPLDRVVLSAFDPWQELLDEGSEGTPGSRWASCLDVDGFPGSAVQATLPFLVREDVVRACRLHDT